MKKEQTVPNFVEMEKDILQCAFEQEGVLGVDSIHTRVFSNKIYADIEIEADGEIMLSESFAIARQVHDVIEERFKK